MSAIKSEQEWRHKLKPQAYAVLRQKATEQPFSGIYNDFFDNGDYHCGACGQSVFSSNQKFASSCGWPSFEEALDGRVSLLADKSHNMERIEVVCSNCGSHLGHVFDDGPTQTGQRYCINSLSLNFQPKKTKILETIFTNNKI